MQANCKLYECLKLLIISNFIVNAFSMLFICSVHLEVRKNPNILTKCFSVCQLGGGILKHYIWRDVIAEEGKACPSFLH